MNGTPDKYRSYFIYLALAITTLAVFWQVHSFEFTNYDDDRYVSQNNHILSGLQWDNVVWVFTKAHGANWHPLTGLSHMLDCQLFGPNPGRHHVINLLFHLANTLLLFTVLRQITGALWQSAFVAALFALHPLHVESVAWISERKDVLSTLFWILTTAAYFHYVKNPSARRYILVLILFALGLMAKPMLVTLPFVLLLLDYWPLNRIAINRGKIKWYSCRKLVWEKTPFFVLSAASSIITFLVQRSAGAVGSNASFTIRTANAVVSYWEYIVMMFWPARLAVFYPHPGTGLPDWQIITAAAVLLVITICVLYLSKKYKYLPVGWFWYIGTLVPVIGLVQVGRQALADRYTYVPLTGLFIIIAWGTNDLLTKWNYRRVILSAGSLVIISALSVCTWLQTSYWRDSESLFKHAIKVTKNNYLAYNNLGVILILQHKFEEAIDPLQKSIQVYPNYGDPLKNLGIAYGKLGSPQKEFEYYNLAIQAYEKDTVINPELPELHKIVGAMLNQQGKPAEAAVHFRKTLALKPLDSQTHSELGTVLGQLGKLDDAVGQFNEALRIDPNSVEAHCNLGYVLLNQDKFDEALAHLAEAAKLDPNSEKSHYYLAIALNEKGKTVEAVTHYEKAIQLKPDWVEPMNTLAWLLATRKDPVIYDPQKALQLARRACELTADKNAENMDTLAAAYAAVSNFPEAVTAAEKALNLAKSEKNNQLADQIQKRLDLYKTGQPYIESVKNKPPIKTDGIRAN